MKKAFICLTLLSLLSCMKGKKVDLIFHNANILCLNDQNSTGEAIAIKDGKIVEIGPERQILNKYRADEVTDVEGKEIVPTFATSYTLNSILTSEKLQEIELSNLEKGITELYVQEVTTQQLNQLKSFSKSMELTWHITLSPTSSTLKFVRNYKSIKKSKFLLQGFSIGDEDTQQIQEAIAIAKNKNLQIGVNFSKAEKHIPFIIQSLKDYKQDHRWFVYQINDQNAKLLTQLEENNFLICANQYTKISAPLYVFFTSTSSENLYYQLNSFTKNNKQNYSTALKSISNWASYLSFSETKKGTLEKGKEANFTILDTPIITSSTKENIYSTTTFIQGKKIYSME